MKNMTNATSTISIDRFAITIANTTTIRIIKPLTTNDAKTNKNDTNKFMHAKLSDKRIHMCAPKLCK